MHLRDSGKFGFRRHRPGGGSKRTENSQNHATLFGLPTSNCRRMAHIRESMRAPASGQASAGEALARLCLAGQVTGTNGTVDR